MQPGGPEFLAFGTQDVVHVLNLRQPFPKVFHLMDLLIVTLLGEPAIRN